MRIQVDNTFTDNHNRSIYLPTEDDMKFIIYMSTKNNTDILYSYQQNEHMFAKQQYLQFLGT